MSYKVKKPCGHRVLVKLVTVEEKSKGGIYLSSGSDLKREQYATEEAEVLMLGETAYKAFDEGEPWCEVGDIVSIRKYSGQDYEYKGEIYRTVQDDDVLCVLEEVLDNG